MNLPRSRNLDLRAKPEETMKKREDEIFNNILTEISFALSDK